MSEKQILSVAIKILGVFVLVHSILFDLLGTSGGMLTLLFSDRSGAYSPTGLLLGALSPLIIGLLFGILLIRYSDAIASQLSSNITINTNATFSPIVVFKLVVGGLGVILLAWTVPPSIAQIALSFSIDPVKGVDYYYPYGAWNMIVVTLIKLALGLYLLRGAPGITKFAKFD